MNSDMAVCLNSECPIHEDCRRFSESGPQCDMQWVAAFEPKYAPAFGWLCMGLIPKETSAVFCSGKDET